MNNYYAMTVGELQSIAKNKRLKKYHTLRKAELIELIINHDNIDHWEMKEHYYKSLSKGTILCQLIQRKLHHRGFWPKSQLINILLKADMDDDKKWMTIKSEEQERVQCCVCYEDMSSDMVTKCNHPVCKICASRLDKYECPLCKRKLDSPYFDSNESRQMYARKIFLDGIEDFALTKCFFSEGVKKVMATEMRYYADTAWIDAIGGISSAYQRGYAALFIHYLQYYK